MTVIFAIKDFLVGYMVIDLLILHIWLRRKGFTTYDYLLLLRENKNVKKKANNGQLTRKDIKHKSKIIKDMKEESEFKVENEFKAKSELTNKIEIED